MFYYSFLSQFSCTYKLRVTTNRFTIFTLSKRKRCCNRLLFVRDMIYIWCKYNNDDCCDDLIVVCIIFSVCHHFSCYIVAVLGIDTSLRNNKMMSVNFEFNVTVIILPFSSKWNIYDNIIFMRESWMDILRIVQLRLSFYVSDNGKCLFKTKSKIT